MEKYKIGIFGLSHRGRDFIKTISFMKDAQLVAVCEEDEEKVSLVKEGLSSYVKVFSDFDEFINCGLDGVILCNYFNEHAPFAIKAFKAGVAVLSETTAAVSLGECVELVEAAQKYSGKYMLTLNCLYLNAVHAMKNRIKSGKTGKIMYAVAEYIHGIRNNSGTEFDLNNLHWRQTMPANYYNMHSLGTLMAMTECEPVTVSCTAILNKTIADKMGRIADTAGSVVITQMDNGAVFSTTGCSDCHTTSKWYRVSGENETVETVRYDSATKEYLVVKTGLPIEKIAPSDFEAGLVNDNMSINIEDVKQSGHGGIDYYTTYHFIEFLKGNEKPFFDVYRSVRLSAVAILGWYSALMGGKTLKVPDFRKKEERDIVREDFRKAIAKKQSDIEVSYNLEDKDAFKLNLNLEV